MLQLENETPFSVDMMVTQSRDGRDTLVVAIKATFDILPEVAISAKQRPVQLGDAYFAEPQASSLKYPSDILLPKPGVDIVYIGSAIAPGEQPVRSLMAGLMVGDIEKRLQIFGDRTWIDGTISKPQPFLSMPIIYEHAFGGVHHFREDLELGADSAVYDAENPIGKGFAGQRKKKAEFNGLTLPNIEQPGALIQHVTDQPEPCCLAAVPPMWSPRKDFAGTYDEQWQKKRAPLLPVDFDQRFFQVGAAGLSLPQASIEGGELIGLHNLAPEPEIEFCLPICRPRIQVKINGTCREVDPVIETVLIEPFENALCLVWKGVVDCERQVSRVEKIHVALQSL
ncbi:MAG: DUF2169 domain-containing protein [Pseudomonadales bacterium]|nr:DUF2169 domain-containing protein [Pseudomonadales bacterium]